MSDQTFRQRFEDAQRRVARLNREKLGTKTLEGSGSQQRLEEIQKKFEAVSLNSSEKPGLPPRLEGPGSEWRLKRIQKRFRALNPRPLRRSSDRTKLGLGLWLIAWATCVGIASSILLSRLDDRWTVIGNLQHLAAYPNCAFARVFAAAPAEMGEPGYWRSHDRDMDGVACEPVPETAT